MWQRVLESWGHAATWCAPALKCRFVAKVSGQSWKTTHGAGVLMVLYPAQECLVIAYMHRHETACSNSMPPLTAVCPSLFSSQLLCMCNLCAPTQRNWGPAAAPASWHRRNLGSSSSSLQKQGVQQQSCKHTASQELCRMLVLLEAKRGASSWQHCHLCGVLRLDSTHRVSGQLGSKQHSKQATATHTVLNTQQVRGKHKQYC